MLSSRAVRTRALLLLTLLTACGSSAVEQDVTLRVVRGGEVVHAAGTITENADSGEPMLAARFTVDAGRTATLLIVGDPPTVAMYEEWRGEKKLFAGQIRDEELAGRLTRAEIGARIQFAFTAVDGSQTIKIEGAATVIEVRGAPQPEASGQVVVRYDDDPTYEDPYYDDTTYDEPSGCESYEPEPEPEPEYEDETWEDSSGGGCGGVEGDTVEDDWDEEEEWESDDWETDESYEGDDSAAGCEGDTYEASASYDRRRTRRIVRGAWLWLWPLGVVAFFNRRARRARS